MANADQNLHQLNHRRRGQVRPRRQKKGLAIKQQKKVQQNLEKKEAGKSHHQRPAIRTKKDDNGKKNKGKPKKPTGGKNISLKELREGAKKA